MEDSIIRNASSVVESSGTEEFRFHRNTVQGVMGGLLAQARNLSIQDNAISDGWGGLAIDCRATMAPAFACVDVAPVRGNRLLDLGGGGILVTADGIIIENNTLERAGFGLFVVGDGLVIRQNTIMDSASLALHGRGTTVYRNNFIASSAEDETGDNAWSLGGMGNYWSDYTGSDANGDGIGDVPYSLNDGVAPGLQDSHPLMCLDGATRCPSERGGALNGHSAPSSESPSMEEDAGRIPGVQGAWATVAPLAGAWLNLRRLRRHGSPLELGKQQDF